MVDALLVPLSPLDQHLLHSFSFTIGYLVERVDTAALHAAAIRVVQKWRLLAGRLEWSKSLSSWCIRVPLEGDVSGRIKFTSSVSTASLDEPFSVLGGPSQILVRPPLKYFHHSSTPDTLQGYASSNAPILSIHVTELKNVTCVGLTVPHGVFDVFVLGQVIIKALNGEMHGRAWDIPPLDKSNIMREALKDLSVTPPSDIDSDAHAEPLPLSGVRHIFGPATMLCKAKFVASIFYDLVWHKVEYKGIYLEESVVRSLVTEVKEKVKELNPTDWVSTGDILVAWFVKSAYAQELNPKVTLTAFLSIRGTLAERDPNFTNYHHNGILMGSTPLLTKKELLGDLHELAICHRRLVKPVRDIEYTRAYLACVASMAGDILSDVPLGEEHWWLTNQVVGDLEDLDLGSDILALWHWNSPLTPSNLMSMNKFNGGYMIQCNTRPEPMNSSPHHPKVKVSMTLAHPIYVAGKYVTGKMEVECRADHGLGVGVIMVELFAVQGPNLPPSNAVQAYPMPGDPLYPPHYHQARRGISTFLFRIPLPSTSPSSISFGSDIARVRYELRATTGVFWKGQKTLVVCKREIDVVESYDVNFYRSVPEGVVIGEYGKIWVQGKVVGDMVIAGESGCLELQVKNHSNKKNTGLTLTLTRNLELPGLRPGETSPLKISDVLTTVPFRGAEYIIEPGVEGVASLVFEVPVDARGVRNGPYEGDEAENRLTDAIFEVQCIIGVTINMGFGAKDIHLDIPVPIVHPAALPEPIELITYPAHPPQPSPFPQILHDPYLHAGPPLSAPILAPYLDPVQNQVWLPPPPTHTNDAPYYAIPVESVEQEYYVPPLTDVNIPTTPLRPMSTGPMGQQPLLLHAMGLGTGAASPPSQHLLAPFVNVDPEEGKGERAMRITQHLRHSSRHRSVSPRSHRFPLPVPPVGTAELVPTPPVLLPSVPVRTTDPILHSPRPFLSPKRSFTNSLPKSERVEDLERMAEEVEKVSADLSGDLPKAPFESQDPESDSSPPIDVTEVQESTVDIPDINKTLPNPPPSIRELNDNLKANGRTRIDELFGDPSSVPPETPRTPMVAVTPIKLPFKPRSAEFRAQLSPNGHAESGLDALEKRLLAEVGTRKMDLANERRPVWSIVGAKPIDIPTKDMVPEEPMNDSAISSLTLAGGCMGNDREEVDVDAGHDSSDEKTHRAKKSTASVGSKKGSKDKEERGKRKSKKVKDKSHGKDGEGNQARKKKTAAVKGKVSA
ncbi:hypothetical protein H0H93_014673, partial [Arthromyces matolae]